MRDKTSFFDPSKLSANSSSTGGNEVSANEISANVTKNAEVLMPQTDQSIPQADVPFQEIPVVPDVTQPAPDMNVTPQQPDSAQFSGVGEAMDIPSTSSSQMSQRVEVILIVLLFDRAR